MSRRAQPALAALGLALLLLPSLPAVAGALLTRDDARQAVIDNAITGSATETTLLAYLYRATASDSVLQAGETVISPDFEESVVFTATSETYFAYVDDFPDEGYEHPVRYVFVDANSGAVTTIDAESFPLVNGTDSPYETIQERFLSDDIFFGDPNVFDMAGSPPRSVPGDDGGGAPAIPSFATFAASDTCGIIIRSPTSKATFDSATATDVKRARRIMESQGVASGAIKEVNPQSGKAMAESLRAAALGKEKLWVYYTGHGWKSKTSKTNGGPYVPGGATKLDRFPTWKAIACSLAAGGAKEVCVIIDCCYSGRAVAEFQKKSINGTITVSSHADSTSKAWARVRTVGSTKTITKAESHYTAALDSCFMDASADTSNPSNGVDQKEAHRWAQKDDLAKKKLPPDAGNLTKMTIELRDVIQIPSSLVDPALYRAEGMTKDPGQNAVFSHFVPNDPNDPLLIVGTEGGPPHNSFPVCLTPAPPQFVEVTDLALIDPVAGLVHYANPATQEIVRSEFCNLTGQDPVPWPLTALARDFHDDLLLGTIAGVDPTLGVQIEIVAMDLVGAQPVPNGFQAPLVLTLQPENPNIEPEDFDVEILPLDDLPVPQTFVLHPQVDPGEAGRGFPTTSTPGPMVTFHRLAEDFEDGPKYLHFGFAPIAETPEAKGLAVLPTPPPAGAPGSQPPSPSPVTLYVLDGIPDVGGFRVLVYDIFGLDDQELVDVPEDGPDAALALAPSVPNPATAGASIAFTLPRDASSARLALYDVRGRLVRTLADGPAAAGEHRVAWNGRDDGGRLAPAGVYFYRLEVVTGAGRESRTRRLVLLP